MSVEGLLRHFSSYSHRGHPNCAKSKEILEEVSKVRIHKIEATDSLSYEWIRAHIQAHKEGNIPFTHEKDA